MVQLSSCTGMLRALPAFIALALAAPTPPAHGQQAASDATLKEVVVTATRTAAEAHKVPATVTRITREEMNRRQPADAADLFKDEPDVALGRDTRRFGATRPNIRGIEDNRVVQMVDGIRLPNFYNGGGPTNFTMNAPLGPSLEFLRRVEILRGPASSLYGSDAIGGVVGFLTLVPGDLLEGDRNFGARARLGYTGANEGVTGTVLGAGRGESLEWLLGYTQTNAEEFGNKGDVDTIAVDRTRPNPQDVRDRGALAKFAVRPAAGHKLTLAAEGRDRDVDVQVLRLSSSLPKVSAMSGDDHSKRARGILEWEYKPGTGWYDRMSARLYQQASETKNFNLQTRTNTSATCSASAGTGNNCRIEQDFLFEQTATGAGVQMEKALADHHFLAFGADLSRLRTEESRDARVFNLTTGGITKSLAGDTFPLRDFAPGYTDTFGFFVQDEIVGLAGGKLTLTPGLRYDRRNLKPEVDALSQGVLAAIGREAVAQTDSALSPKLAALWQFSPATSAYGQIMRGFRAPNYEEVNGHFRNTAQRYGISPNPNLEPETSTGVEVGLRLNRDRLRGQLAAFDNRYRNFISNVRLACPGELFISNLREANNPKAETAAEFLARELRTRQFHPGWIEGMQREGYSGSTELLDSINNFWGWQVTAPDIARADQWQEFADVYVRDKYRLGLKDWFERANPAALAQMIERMLEAVRKDYRQADAATVRELAQRYQDLAYRHDVRTDNSKFNEFVARAAGYGLAAASLRSTASRPQLPPRAELAPAAPQVRGMKLAQVLPPATVLLDALQRILAIALLLAAATLGGLAEARRDRHPRFFERKENPC